jgi:hypothetical protein
MSISVSSPLDEAASSGSTWGGGDVSEGAASLIAAVMAGDDARKIL